MTAPHSCNGGLTLIPIPGFEDMVTDLKDTIEAMGRRSDHFETPVDITALEFGNHPSRERKIEFTDRSINGHDCVIVGGGPGTDAMLMNLAWTVAHVAGRHARRISLVTPYFPHSRSDVDEGETVLAKMRMVHTLITSQTGELGYLRWICFDPHAKQISDIDDPGKVAPIYLTRRLLRFALTEFATRYSGEKVVLAYPDDSGEKRYEPALNSIARERNRDFHRICAYKRRDMFGKSKIVAIVGDTPEAKDTTILMFDDEIDTGGSVVELANRLKQEFGARAVWACATHAVMSLGATDRFIRAREDGLVERLILSDTIPIKSRPALQALVDQGMLTVYSCMEDLAWVIYRIHWDMSIRQMR